MRVMRRRKSSIPVAGMKREAEMLLFFLKIIPNICTVCFLSDIIGVLIEG